MKLHHSMRLHNTVRHRLHATAASVFLAGLFVYSPAYANQVFTTDGAFGLKDFFGDDEIVYASGDVDTKPSGPFVIFPEGDVCIVPAGSLTGGGGIADVTAGGCNTVIGTSLGGAFFDEIVWLPPLTRGLYDIVIDENQNRIYDAPDSAPHRFQVGSPVGVSIDIAAIKEGAEKTAESYKNMEKSWKLMSDGSAAVGIGMALWSGDVVSAVVGSVSLGLAQIGIDFPTDYNAGVIAVGGKVIAGLAGQMNRKYTTLKNDPPTPDYDQLVSLDLTSVNSELVSDTDFLPGLSAERALDYPHSPQGDSDMERAQVAVKNHLALQSALVTAFTTTLERFQGAEAANQRAYTYYQAKALKRLGELLTANLTDTQLALLDYQDQFEQSGLKDAVYTANELQIIKNKIVNDGFTPEEIERIKAAGFSDAGVAHIIAFWSALELPDADFTRADIFDDFDAVFDEVNPVFQAASAQAQAVMNDLGPFLIEQFPTAQAGGPYSVVAGNLVTLNGSASSHPKNLITTYEWDLDLDGEFDDAIGVNPSVSFDSTYRGKIGLRVTDANGFSDIAYADLTVDSGNQAPAIVSFSPAAHSLTASIGETIAFSVVAEDPDFDPLTFSWSVNDVPVGTDSGYTFHALPGMLGPQIIRVVISDGNPLSPDVSDLRVVNVVDGSVALISVPSVTGLIQAEAETILLAAGLNVGHMDLEASATVPAGAVISQAPLPGAEIAPGSTVDLVISSGTAITLLCDVDGNGVIDRTDLSLISRSRGQTVFPGDPRDSDKDGKITPNDVSVCISLMNK